MLPITKNLSATCLIFGLFLTANSCLAQKTESSDSSSKTEQASAPSASLSDRQTFKTAGFEFSLQPPAGYALDKETSDNATTFGWAAKRRADGSCAGILVQALNLPSASGLDITDQQVLTKYMAEGGNGAKVSYQEGTKEFGGRKYAAAEFQRELSSGTKVVGYIYVTKVDSSNFLIMLAQDRPDNQSDLDLARKAHESLQIESAASPKASN